MRVRFEAKTRTALRLFVLADPAPGNDGNDDRSNPSETMLIASDDTAASAIAASPALGQTSSGYRGTASDPWRDLQDFTLKGTDATQAGNVVQAARTGLDGKDNQSMTLSIGFGRDAGAATTAATGSLGGGFDAAQAAYDSGWSGYLASLKAPPAPVAGNAQMRRLYEQSLLVLAGFEDKVNRGASIAAPNMPWVWGTLTLSGSEQSDPYHLVWPRDFYHAATAQKAAGDDAAADRLVDYLWKVQKADGSFWQNTRVDGTPVWTSEQLDETALPVVLAWWLGRTAPDGLGQHPRRGRLPDRPTRTARAPARSAGRTRTATRRTRSRPRSRRSCAPPTSRGSNGDAGRAAAYEAKADEWQAKVESWTATDNGPYSPKPYYLRVTKDGNPNDGSTYTLGDNFDRARRRARDRRQLVPRASCCSASSAIRRPGDPQLAGGRRRAGRAAAGEHAQRPVLAPLHVRRLRRAGATAATGTCSSTTRQRQTLGRAWPLLAGERGEYELIAGKDASARLQAIADAANDGLMLPEQVWDGRPPNESEGEGTRSATPLAWTHAAFVRLAWSIQAGEPIERPSIVACRYQQQLCRLSGLSARGPTRPGTPRPGSPPGSRGSRRGRSARPRGPRSGAAGRRR